MYVISLTEKLIYAVWKKKTRHFNNTLTANGFSIFCLKGLYFNLFPLFCENDKKAYIESNKRSFASKLRTSIVVPDITWTCL